LLDAVSSRPGTVRDGNAVTQSSPIGMSVVVAPGFVIVGARSATNGKYLVEVTANDTVTVPAASTFTRTDQIVTEVLDTAFGDPQDLAHNIDVPGLSTGPATLTPNQTLLATVTVAPGQSSVTAGNIVDKRKPSNPTPLGYIARNSGPSVTVDCTTSYRDVVIVTAPVTIGRLYRTTALFNGTQVTATGNSRAQLVDDQGGQTYVAFDSTLPAGEVLIGTGVLLTQSTSTRTATFRLQAESSAGAIRAAAPNTCTILVEDIGSA
jgi:hypothetical protein